MNSLIGFLFLLIAINVLIFFIAKQYKRIWKIASGIFILSSPIFFFATMHVIGEKVGDGLAGGFAAFTFSGRLIINAIFLFVVNIIISINRNA
ncbi:hypothetical protein [Bacillus cereus group sp. BfR-BA-01523]|uniref:hypothetical protein n=1 Tax=Bacillus cereus group sp. BfR-BA-01523 TaxID=2920371 RepID=UPI001F571EC1|nr:hypothetical protein [Bacillus cereus group sp. BfR-BA-01523]